MGGGQVDDGPDQIPLLGRGHLIELREQHAKTGVTTRIDRVPEPREYPLPSQGVIQGALGPVAFGLDQEGVGQLAGPAMQRSGDGPEPSQEGIAQIGPG
jgi:hypothetical protein